MEAAVRVVTVAALYESDIDAMAVRTRKFGLLLRMAAVAELRLALDEQGFRCRGMVGRMTAEATDTLGEMNRLAERAVLKV